MTSPHFFQIRTASVALALALMLALPAVLTAEVTSRDLTVDVGQAKVHLLNPSGLIRIDGLSQETDQALARYQSEGIKTLSVYAEPLTWRNYKEAASQPGAKAGLDFYAFILVPMDFINDSLTLEDFQEWKGFVAADDELEACEQGERFITCRIKAGADKSQGLLTHILVEGKPLTLGTFSGPKNQFADQFEPGALEWRDAYLEITKP